MRALAVGGTMRALLLLVGLLFVCGTAMADPIPGVELPDLGEGPDPQPCRPACIGDRWGEPT